MPELGGALAGMGQRKNGTAAPGHEGVENPGLFAKPALHGGEPKIFRESRRLEIVAKRNAGKGFSSFAGLRILGVGLVSPGSGDPESGVHEQALKIAFQRNRFDEFAAAPANGRPMVNEEGNIATQPRGELREPVIGTIDFRELPQGEENSGGVAASASQSRAYRDIFFQMNANSRAELELIEEKARGPRGEIILRIGERGIGAGEFDFRGNEIDLQGVAQGDGSHQRFQLVKAVGAAAQDMEIEVDLGGRELFHWIAVNLQPG
jgi:hypothetical protein